MEGDSIPGTIEESDHVLQRCSIDKKESNNNSSDIQIYFDYIIEIIKQVWINRGYGDVEKSSTIELSMVELFDTFRDRCIDLFYEKLLIRLVDFEVSNLYGYLYKCFVNELRQVFRSMNPAFTSRNAQIGRIVSRTPEMGMEGSCIVLKGVETDPLQPPPSDDELQNISEKLSLPAVQHSERGPTIDDMEMARYLLSLLLHTPKRKVQRKSVVSLLLKRLNLSSSINIRLDEEYHDAEGIPRENPLLGRKLVSDFQEEEHTKLCLAASHHRSAQEIFINLSSKERLVYWMEYASLSDPPWRNKEMASELHVTEGRVSQLRTSLIGKLSKYLPSIDADERQEVLCALSVLMRKEYQ